MKSRIFVLTAAITFALFSVFCTSYAQSKETKTQDKTVKKEINKPKETHQTKKIQIAGSKTIESKTNTSGKAGVAKFKGINNKLKTVQVNQNDKQIKQTEWKPEHHKKYYNKSVTKNKLKENANKQKEKK